MIKKNTQIHTFKRYSRNPKIGGELSSYLQLFSHTHPPLSLYISDVFILFHIPHIELNKTRSPKNIQQSPSHPKHRHNQLSIIKTILLISFWIINIFKEFRIPTPAHLIIGFLCDRFTTVRFFGEEREKEGLDIENDMNAENWFRFWFGSKRTSESRAFCSDSDRIKKYIRIRRIRQFSSPEFEALVNIRI